MAMNFKEGRWNHEINVTDFVKTNITPYEGDASFLVGPTERTKAVWNKCLEALAEERANNGVRSLDPSTVSTITSFAAGYIDKDNEVIVGLHVLLYPASTMSPVFSRKSGCTGSVFTNCSMVFRKGS